MDPASRKRLVAQLARAFGRASDVSPAPEQPLHVLLGAVELPSPWSPSPTPMLTIWPNWPAERPKLLVPQDLVGEGGEPPRSSSEAYHLGQAWNAFSFAFAWSGSDPIRAIQLWLTRFDGESI